ncbi:KTSC domain-containing protein [Mesorhizobium sanjuanii]|nr:KTSC domain-containing protein [Mesorhizobium sanjuanii]
MPAETYAAFRNAFAKGRFFNAHIRDQFRYRHAGGQENTG